MARVTVEDCVELVPNRFELVMIAAQRARNIHGGQEIKVDRDNDKNPVIALREIADQEISLDDLREELIRGHQRPPEVDVPEDEIVELMAGETGYQGNAPAEGEPLPEGMSMDGDDDDDADDMMIGGDDAADGAGDDE